VGHGFWPFSDGPARGMYHRYMGNFPTSSFRG
jgi:hypothetical protein